MEAVYTWVKNFIFCLCLLELFCHLVRNEDYRRYIRFFGGLVVLLLVISPLMQFFSLGEAFGEALRQALAAEEVRELQISQEALAGLQNQKISEAYEKALKRQIEEIVRSHGQQALSVKLKMEQLDGRAAEIAGITILLAAAKSNPGETPEESPAADRQKKNIEEIRAEIISIYGVDDEEIMVSVKEQR